MSLHFYADFACPFCHIENERLEKHGLQDAIEFRPVSLLPDAPVPWDVNDPIVTKIMAAGWERFMTQIADEGQEVVQPDSLPNTQGAARAIASARVMAPEKESALRTALYRALWREGRDIGVHETLMDVWRQVGLPKLERFDRDARRATWVWRSQWESGPFEKRVPVIANDDHQRLLGLPTEEEMLAFMKDNRAGLHAGDLCEVR